MDQPRTGSLLGHYKILRQLGAGGMGVVYEAEDQKLGRHVALKFISADADGVALERFWREARTASALNHPGICTIYEINDTGDTPFLAMELLEGQTLDRVYGGQAVPIPRLIELGAQLADALDAAHRKGILHRDIKPANIFVTGSGQTKILDFGLARFQDLAGTDSTAAGTAPNQMLTSPGSTLGTIAYMSPEQARGEQLDARTDIFSLGVVLYEMATGKHPFGGTTTAVVFDKLLNYVPPAAISLNHDLPVEFESILGKALEKDRELRYQSAADLRADLRRLQRRSSGAHASSAAVPLPATGSYAGMTRMDSMPRMAAAPATPAPAASAPVPRSPAARRRLRISQPVRIASLGAAVIILAFGVWRHAHKAPPAAAIAAPAAATFTATTPAATPSTAKATAPTPAAAPVARPSAATYPESERRDERSSRAHRVETPVPSAQPSPRAPAPALAARSAALVAHADAAPAQASRKPEPPATATYSARHMRLFGRSSSGKLQLTPAYLSFTSPDDSVTLTRAQIRAIDGDSVVETSGRKWRFEINGMSAEQVHQILARWLAAGASGSH